MACFQATLAWFGLISGRLALFSENFQANLKSGLIGLFLQDIGLNFFEVPGHPHKWPYLAYFGRNCQIFFFTTENFRACGATLSAYKLLHRCCPNYAIAGQKSWTCFLVKADEALWPDCNLSNEQHLKLFKHFLEKYIFFLRNLNLKMVWNFKKWTKICYFREGGGVDLPLWKVA